MKDFPDFSEFLRTLDADTISGIFKDANGHLRTLRENYSDEENLTAHLLHHMSLTISQEILAVYHKWLSQSL